MQINIRKIKNSIIRQINFHDAYIMKVIKNNNQITLLLQDDYQREKLYEMTFTNYKINNKFDLDERTIYQFEDLCYFDLSKWNMSLLIWTNDNLLESIRINADNIITKEYNIKDNLIEKDNIYEKMDELKAHIGELTISNLKKKSTEKLIQKIFKIKEKEAILDDFNNYILINEENLNDIIEESTFK